MKFEPRTADSSVNIEQGGQLGEAAKLFAGFAVLMVGVVVLLFLAVEFGVRLISPETEARWFAEEFAPPVDAAPWGARGELAADLLDRLAAHWPQAPYAFRLRVVDAGGPNAFALPGGTIVVTRKLLDSVASENELAFVLAHELGHFHGRDHLRGMGRALSLGLVLSAVGGSSAGDLASSVGSLTLLRFGREQESAADAFAVDLVTAEYGHAAAATHFFERMRERFAIEDEAAAQMLAWTATHPLSEARIRAIEARAASRGISLSGSVVALDDGADAARARQED